MNLPEKEFVEWLQQEGIMDKTVYLYRLDLKFMDTFTQKGVEEMIEKRPAGRTRSFLKKYKEFLLDNKEKLGLTDEQYNRINNIRIRKAKKVKPKLPKYALLEHVRKMSINMDKREHQFMLWLSWYGGLRKAELVNIRFRDFNWEEWARDKTKPGLLKIVGKGGVERVVPINYKLMVKIEKWINYNWNWSALQTDKKLFKVSYRNWANILERACVAADIPKINPHALRHGIAMHLIKKGWKIEEVKEFLRHTSIMNTQIYAKVSPESMMEKYSKTV